MRRIALPTIVVAAFFAVPLFAEDMVTIPSGSFRPFDLAKDQKNAKIRRFQIDKYPVSTADFAAFLEKNPAWQKEKISRIRADKGYLQGVALNPPLQGVAMTQVSWYAARAYCRAKGKRLPTLNEWEYVATYNKWDALPANNERILKWFAQPNDTMPVPRLGTGLKSPQGVYDLHGLIWEWVEDFNSSTVTGDSRADTDTNSNMFCGATALTGSDLRNYTAYMRYGMRSSLKGNYTGLNLGFRCAKEIK
ncbi:MAG: Serine/threonine-protein kinase pkn1 [Turneriella sp.]|nr:Serine/threonine-protein kinase pkn1 [Turneriella sp.]